MRYLLVGAYLLAIAGANILTATLAPWLLHVSGEIVAIPAGTWAIACTFWLRDLVQVRWGLYVTYGAIVTALALNLALSLYYGDLLAITLASAGAFAISETADTVIYSRTRGRLGRRIIVSGFVSCPLDSAVFVIFGLSPLTTGIIPWSAVALTIVVQVVIKVALQAVAAIPMWRMNPATA